LTEGVKADASTRSPKLTGVVWTWPSTSWHPKSISSSFPRGPRVPICSKMGSIFF